MEENTYDIDAGLSIVEANEPLGLSLPSGRYKTVAGLVLEQLRRMPETDDEAVVGDVHFRVLEMQGFRISRLVVTHTPSSEDSPDQPSE